MQQIREQLHQLLQQNQPPKDSAAWEDYSMNLALNEWLITKNAKRKKELEKQIANDLDRGVEADFTIIKYLDREQTALDFVVPKRWKKYLHKSGHSGLGLKDFWKDVFFWALPLWLFACAFVWWMPAEQTGCEGEIYEYRYQEEELTLCINRPQNRILLNEYLTRDALEESDTLKADSLTAAIRGIVNFGIDPIRNEEEADDEMRLDSAGIISFKNLAVDYYNIGVALMERTDSLTSVGKDAVESLNQQICYYFNKARNLDEGGFPGGDDLDIREAVQWCRIATLPENVPLAGVIYEEGSGNPIENVKVTYQNRADITDNYGRFSFPVSRSSIGREVHLNIEKLDYETIARDFSVAKNDSIILVLGITRLKALRNVNDIGGQQETSITYSLSGKIIDQESKKAPTGKVLIASQKTRTEMRPNGKFSLSIPVAELENGTARVIFTGVGYRDIVQIVDFNNSVKLNLDITLQRIQPLVPEKDTIPPNIGGQSGPVQQQPQTTPSGSETNLQLEILASDNEDQPVFNVTLTLKDMANGEILVQQTQPDNHRFLFDLEAGKDYEVVASLPAYSSASLKVSTRGIIDNPRISRRIYFPRAIASPEIPIPEMVALKGGTFTMGCTKEQREDCGEDEKPAHEVRLNDFSIGKYEITNEEYATFLNAKGNQEEGGVTWIDLENSNIEQINGQYKAKKGLEKHPVNYVSWYGARAYPQWLSEVTRKPYRLPTEAEWEYAARGGQKSKNYKYSGSDDIEEVAWYDENSNNQPRPIGTTKKSNELGIYDMSGNVWEWCQDKWHDTYKGAPTNGSAWETGSSSFRVLRSGSWDYSAKDCRVAFRYYINPSFRRNNDGLRIALSL